MLLVTGIAGDWITPAAMVIPAPISARDADPVPDSQAGQEPPPTAEPVQECQPLTT